MAQNLCYHSCRWWPFWLFLIYFSKLVWLRFECLCHQKSSWDARVFYPLGLSGSFRGCYRCSCAASLLCLAWFAFLVSSLCLCWCACWSSLIPGCNRSGTPRWIGFEVQGREVLRPALPAAMDSNPPWLMPGYLFPNFVIARPPWILPTLVYSPDRQDQPHLRFVVAPGYDSAWSEQSHWPITCPFPYHSVRCGPFSILQHLNWLVTVYHIAKSSRAHPSLPFPRSFLLWSGLSGFCCLVSCNLCCCGYGM